MPRYIDADKIKYLEFHHRDPRISKFDFITTKADIESIPAEDVVPVKHGHWENEYYIPECDNFFHTCSCCHRESIDYGDKNFCPVCGAKMDE